MGEKCRLSSSALLTVVFATSTVAQNVSDKPSSAKRVAQKVELPNCRTAELPNWWAGKKWNRLQVMVTGEQLNDAEFSFANESLNISDAKVVLDGKYDFLLMFQTMPPLGTTCLKSRKEIQLRLFHFQSVPEEMVLQPTKGSDVKVLST